MGDGPAVGNMDYGRSERGRSCAPAASRHGNQGCIFPLPRQWEFGRNPPRGCIASDVGDAMRLEDLLDVEIPYYDANPANLDDFIFDWEDFAEEVVGEMRQDARDKWACRTFPHRLAPELKADLRDQIREKRISTEEQCLDWLEPEERVAAPNQTLDDLWSIPLNLKRRELRLRDCRRYLRKYRRLLKQVEDWTESSQIRHLL